MLAHQSLAPISLAPKRSAVLTGLLGCVNVLWHKVAESLPHLKAIAEDINKTKRAHRTASPVAIRVFFHLEDPEQALGLALEGERITLAWLEIGRQRTPSASWGRRLTPKSRGRGYRRVTAGPRRRGRGRMTATGETRTAMWKMPVWTSISSIVWSGSCSIGATPTVDTATPLASRSRPGRRPGSERCWSVRARTRGRPPPRIRRRSGMPWMRP